MNESVTRKSVAKRILLGVVIALVLLYIVFLFITTNFLGNNSIVTEIAYRTTAHDVIKVNALAVRDEEYIQSSVSGVLVYNVRDGDKVTADGTIATAYQNENDIVSLQRIDEIDEQITYLESLNTLNASVNVGLDTVNSQIDDHIVELASAVNAQSFSKLPDYESNLITAILRKQVITGEQGSFDNKITALKNERETLRSGCGNPVGTISSGSSGYFVSKTDGYEQAFDLEKLDEISYADFQNIKPKELNEGAYIGKIIKGVNWYILCPVSADEAANISHNEAEVHVRMPYALSEEIPAKVVSVNRFADEDKTMVVLQCNYMNDAISKIRREAIEIVVNDYEGLKISKSALHDDVVERTVTDKDDETKTKTETKKVQGVYVEYGSELVFKQVVIEYSGEDYVICSEEPDEDALFNGRTVELYDQVVVEGGDLFNGKIIQ